MLINLRIYYINSLTGSAKCSELDKRYFALSALFLEMHEMFTKPVRQNCSGTGIYMPSYTREKQQLWLTDLIEIWCFPILEI